MKSMKVLEEARVKRNISEDKEPKEVVHVRARRVQATDSHILAKMLEEGKSMKSLGAYRTLSQIVYSNSRKASKEGGARFLEAKQRSSLCSLSAWALFLEHLGARTYTKRMLSRSSVLRHYKPQHLGAEL